MPGGESKKVVRMGHLVAFRLLKNRKKDMTLCTIYRFDIEQIIFRNFLTSFSDPSLELPEQPNALHDMDGHVHRDSLWGVPSALKKYLKKCSVSGLTSLSNQ